MSVGDKGHVTLLVQLHLSDKTVTTVKNFDLHSEMSYALNDTVLNTRKKNIVTSSDNKKAESIGTNTNRIVSIIQKSPDVFKLVVLKEKEFQSGYKLSYSRSCQSLYEIDNNLSKLSKRKSRSCTEIALQRINSDMRKVIAEDKTAIDSPRSSLNNVFTSFDSMPPLEQRRQCRLYELTQLEEEYLIELGRIVNRWKKAFRRLELKDYISSKTKDFHKESDEILKLLQTSQDEILLRKKEFPIASREKQNFYLQTVGSLYFDKVPELLAHYQLLARYDAEERTHKFEELSLSSLLEELSLSTSDILNSLTHYFVRLHLCLKHVLSCTPRKNPDHNPLREIVQDMILFAVLNKFNKDNSLRLQDNIEKIRSDSCPLPDVTSHSKVRRRYSWDNGTLKKFMQLTRSISFVRSSKKNSSSSDNMKENKCNESAGNCGLVKEFVTTLDGSATWHSTPKNGRCSDKRPEVRKSRRYCDGIRASKGSTVDAKGRASRTSSDSPKIISNGRNELFVDAKETASYSSETNTAGMLSDSFLNCEQQQQPQQQQQDVIIPESSPSLVRGNLDFYSYVGERNGAVNCKDNGEGQVEYLDVKTSPEDGGVSDEDSRLDNLIGEKLQQNNRSLNGRKDFTVSRLVDNDSRSHVKNETHSLKRIAKSALHNSKSFDDSMLFRERNGQSTDCVPTQAACEGRSKRIVKHRAVSEDCARVNRRRSSTNSRIPRIRYSSQGYENPVVNASCNRRRSTTTSSIECATRQLSSDLSPEYKTVEVDSLASCSNESKRMVHNCRLKEKSDHDSDDIVFSPVNDVVNSERGSNLSHGGAGTNVEDTYTNSCQTSIQSTCMRGSIEKSAGECKTDVVISETTSLDRSASKENRSGSCQKQMLCRSTSSPPSPVLSDELNVVSRFSSDKRNSDNQQNTLTICSDFNKTVRNMLETSFSCVELHKNGIRYGNSTFYCSTANRTPCLPRESRKLRSLSSSSAEEQYSSNSVSTVCVSNGDSLVRSNGHSTVPSQRNSSLTSESKVPQVSKSSRISTNSSESSKSQDESGGFLNFPTKKQKWKGEKSWNGNGNGITSPISVKKLLDKKRKLSKDQAVAWATCIDTLLLDKSGIKVFEIFLRLEYSEENLLFWLACESFKCLNTSKIVKEALRIYKLFIEVNSSKETPDMALACLSTFPFFPSNTLLIIGTLSTQISLMSAAGFINLDHATRVQLREAIRNPDKTIFDQAQKRVKNLMALDSYPRFIKSPIYQALV
eukprot:gene16156-17779_t